MIEIVTYLRTADDDFAPPSAARRARSRTHALLGPGRRCRHPLHSRDVRGRARRCVPVPPASLRRPRRHDGGRKMFPIPWADVPNRTPPNGVSTLAEREVHVIRPFLGPVVWPNFGNLRDYLWQEIPEARHAIAELEEENEEIFGEPDPGTYSYLSEAFFGPVLSKALDTKQHSSSVLERYFGFIESLFSSDDGILIEAVGLNVSEALCGRRRWLEAARVFGGPLLKRDLARIVTHPEWFDSGFQGPIPQDDPAE